MAAPTVRMCLQLLVGVSLLLAVSPFTDDDFEVVTDSVLTVEHTFDSGPNPTYTKRGTIYIQSIKAGSAEFTQERGLTDDEQDKLKDLVKKDGLYRIRVTSKSPDNTIRTVTSFAKACALYESRLTDTLTVHLDMATNIIGVSVTTPVPYCVGVAPEDSDLDDFSTTVEVIQTWPGPAPETQSFIEKIETEKMQKEKGQQPDNRSFFAKYWMYIVPVVIFMMFANTADSGGGAAAGGGGR